MKDGVKGERSTNDRFRAVSVKTGQGLKRGDGQRLKGKPKKGKHYDAGHLSRKRSSELSKKEG